MSILLALALGLYPLYWPTADTACRHLVPVARTAMEDALRKEGATFPVPWLDNDRFWVGRHLR